jgi:hypothetical protein
MPSPSYVPVIPTGRDVSFKSVTVVGATNLTTVFQSQVSGDAFPRATLNAGGGYAFGSGAGPTDTNLYRNGPNILRTDSNLQIGGTLGVAGAVAATTPGAVVKKLQIFDDTGASLGFLPVYSSIT